MGDEHIVQCVNKYGLDPECVGLSPALSWLCELNLPGWYAATSRGARTQKALR